ncbi:hypothetical protein RFI_34834 [Reticulomyxa filosa]|uniref:Uncharacterized protein n=1 Tax=Reticulomyxa filosa TaxID=46433 RepID=X6LKV8_RETFI|nr:hypothetical protein RFI_34834 [Reticulomyxa filosa]|eukprot:ETO02583.1 hypothetical protein RFI_34834 [Reticulomyxa filosa]
MIAINQIQYFNNKVKECNELNNKLQKLIEENQNLIEKEWNERNSQEIAIFFGYTLKCKKSKISQYNEIIKEKKID